MTSTPRKVVTFRSPEIQTEAPGVRAPQYSTPQGTPFLRGASAQGEDQEEEAVELRVDGVD
jgi:hypothetical protein